MKKSVIIVNIVAIIVWLIVSAIFGIIALSSGEFFDTVMYLLFGPLLKGYYIVCIIHLLFLYLYYRVGLFRVYFWVFIILIILLGVAILILGGSLVVLGIFVIFGFLVIPLFFLMLLVILFYFFYVRIRLPENERSI